MRQRLQTTADKILLPGKRWSDKPTGKMLLALVSGLTVSRVDSGPWAVSSPPHMTARARQVSQLSGYDLDIIYASRTPDHTAPPRPDLE